jgi:hypothetical protein
MTYSDFYSFSFLTRHRYIERARHSARFPRIQCDLFTKLRAGRISSLLYYDGRKTREMRILVDETQVVALDGADSELIENTKRMSGHSHGSVRDKSGSNSQGCFGPDEYRRFEDGRDRLV